MPKAQFTKRDQLRIASLPKVSAGQKLPGRTTNKSRAGVVYPGSMSGFVRVISADDYAIYKHQSKTHMSKKDRKRSKATKGQE